MTRLQFRPRLSKKDLLIFLILLILASSQIFWIAKFSDAQNYLLMKTHHNSGDIYTLEDCYERDLKPCDASWK